MSNGDIERQPAAPVVAKLGADVLSIGGAVAIGGLAGGVTGAGLGSAVGFVILGPAGAGVGFLLGIVGGVLTGTLAAGMTANWIRRKLESK